MVPSPVRLFHITAVANLPAIAASGALLSKNVGAAAGINYQNIAHRGAQGARAVRSVPNPPGGVVHDYVPFYFAPRSPMLSAIEHGRIGNCSWRQGDIVHLETSVERVISGKVPFVFYDRNATLAFAQPYTDLGRLDAVAWPLLTEAPTLDGFCKYWHNRVNVERYADRMERRQAEFLIRERVPLERFVRIGVMDGKCAAEVRAILGAGGVNLPVDVRTDWYFLGQ
jgi:ssDNA thymidine ADP-ribosyltransferase, DarT